MVRLGKHPIKFVLTPTERRVRAHERQVGRQFRFELLRSAPPSRGMDRPIDDFPQIDLG
jgi:hypothetical protein